ncbi:MAG: 3'(2'),5'-bisphosphate nucleotidase CysQ [Nitrospiria bacterium]
MENLLFQVVQLSEEAGRAIMSVYSGGDFGTTLKADHSPLTRADTESHNIILQGLKLLSPQLHLLSEESEEPPYSERRTWDSYWLADPLDGTKEFINHTGEFTVNIALIEKGNPILGVIHIPFSGISYFAFRGNGAYKKEPGKMPYRISTGDYRDQKLKIICSRLHQGAVLEDFLKKIKGYESVNVGSSIKFCLIADGSAHLYPRLSPTMEWDTAAGQCIVSEAGGTVTDFERNPLKYNKPNLENPNFIVCGNPPFPWWE